MAGGILIMAAEIVGGVLSHSLVLLADAAHYATDVLAVGIAFIAVTLAARPATDRKSFGYKRAEVLAAFLNAAALWGISAYFLYEAYRRLANPPQVGGKLILFVGGFSLLANVALALTLAKAGGRNINMRAAYLHILSDVLGSAAALAAGAATTFFGWQIADPILTLFITVLILAFTWRLTKETLNILLQGTPDDMDMEEVERTIREIAPVKEVHELHVWSLTSGSEVLSVHVVLDAPPRDDLVTHQIHEKLKAKYKIDHVTVQVESPDCPCTSARCHPRPGNAAPASE
jgi:cobalt-zinc-cadmium efflux system protein